MPTDTVLSLLKKSTAFFEEKGVDEAKRSAEYLLAHAMGQKRLQLYLRFDQPVADDELARFRELVRRRLRREPVQYIVGSTEFFGMEFSVSPAVLIPRPETEHLVEAVIDRARADGGTEEKEPGLRILDIGTGSGIIAIVLAANLARARVTAVDVSEAALAVARENAASNNVAERIDFHPHDILAAQRDDIAGPFDIIVSNPPYVSARDMSELQPEILGFEPATALTDNGDGLTFYRRIRELLPHLLVPNGLLAVEIGFGQAPAVVEIFSSVLRDIDVIKDYSGVERVVVGMMADGRMAH
ncbi:MAG: peptide chain release factor N(5)-glutamine methyltransferase [Bacteroidota bacterium]|nr:peptide chain release factor N(5)-glutamine methyltransferase [Bacteroidota bacterium]